ncbi:Tim44/TimA family putative adaptor protein [Chelatococcus composti]|jgi:predicted lipid-binding transport protein (Tim44 family)|uniref:Putative lipid-binding transport protein (Tim44 family) n=1 Tax=Chelatococcus composti TaxID=1743235 RepID=A0A841K4R4_9HYPH|nr:Tim44/TimA family putative adaptor protein [Chelatococcus composti]MBB6167481.1 putative lipid-binding transport protein (Tim44 family) [Chelatococcus composti]MBS7735686.1 Tim44 domain-containing protein [Chelatococcus composti]PZN44628.1 MAG: calcium-binding protein [Pseudomonadota bacterium]GGG32252.1 calcium-binding protein [Chelatococcus composti]
MQDTFDITTIVFLALAVFVIWRLRSVLGQRTGNERPPHDPFARREQAKPTGEDNVVRLPGAANDRGGVTEVGAQTRPDRWAGVAEEGSATARGFDAIAAVEPQFDARKFLEGARLAYEMIVTSFAAGDRKTLKGLLSRDVYEGFEKAIADRETRGEKVETTFVSIDDAKVEQVEVRGKAAQITVRFLSKLITATRDKDGKVIDGDPETVADVVDVWTFSRTLGARDPNWLLVATESGQ